ncbi:Amino-acid transporter arg-13 [Neolecta irregularis DAH-3]|uniref:Amino-acid transporter arg-13 n=1 Tax=Neolecta irregularis (strain DAH-3) TaxID=1198029 RepID=A0A1U7LRL7_NEOID|nr:Amino-acid transporter arg-13 [Neolecta irregularis DAH-3]|eukprot:OLL25192.1 Amino-acid transporter arg-13 [Neolecta irregularis DAH-3]
MIYSRAKTFLQSNIYHCDLPISGLVAAGSISGLASSFILTPIELIKCKLQVQIVPTTCSTADSFYPPGPLALCVQTYRNHGITGLWRGQMGTLVRETGGGAAWFGIYEYITMLCRNKSHQKNTSSEMMLAGALSGMGYNLVLFPADSIKSRMQTDASSGMLQTASDIWRSLGIKGFYRGCGITVARSAPSSAVIFLVFAKLVEFDREV